MAEKTLQQMEQLDKKVNLFDQELQGDLNEIPILSFDDELSVDFDESLLSTEEAIIDYVEEEDGIEQQIIDELEIHSFSDNANIDEENELLSSGEEVNMLIREIEEEIDKEIDYSLINEQLKLENLEINQVEKVNLKDEIKNKKEIIQFNEEYNFLKTIDLDEEDEEDEEVFYNFKIELNEIPLNYSDSTKRELPADNNVDNLHKKSDYSIKSFSEHDYRDVLVSNLENSEDSEVFFQNNISEKEVAPMFDGDIVEDSTSEVQAEEVESLSESKSIDIDDTELVYDLDEIHMDNSENISDTINKKEFFDQMTYQVFIEDIEAPKNKNYRDKEEEIIISDNNKNIEIENDFFGELSRISIPNNGKDIVIKGDENESFVGTGKINVGMSESISANEPEEMYIEKEKLHDQSEEEIEIPEFVASEEIEDIYPVESSDDFVEAEKINVDMYESVLANEPEEMYIEKEELHDQSEEEIEIEIPEFVASEETEDIYYGELSEVFVEAEKVDIDMSES
ncbi:MAG: hypothetical protein OEV44_07900, partial [Spirochaetota bacterium]|nr:hypothetical protein [Spirochaetota bacterium]